MRVTVDAVVFSVLDKDLKVLLIRRKKAPHIGKFALPGGFVYVDEELEDAVMRELEEETGVKNVFLKQLDAYGAIGRDPLRGSVLTVAFLALIKGDQKLYSTADAAEAKWFSISDLPELAFDHSKILQDALRKVVNNEEYQKACADRFMTLHYLPPEDYEATCKNGVGEFKKGIEAIEWEKAQFAE